MGYAGGSRIMVDIIYALLDEELSDLQRARLYVPIIEALEGEDWDTQDEAMGVDPVFDKVLDEMYPDEDEDDDDPVFDAVIKEMYPDGDDE